MSVCMRSWRWTMFLVQSNQQMWVDKHKEVPSLRPAQKRNKQWEGQCSSCLDRTIHLPGIIIGNKDANTDKPVSDQFIWHAGWWTEWTFRMVSSLCGRWVTAAASNQRWHKSSMSRLKQPWCCFYLGQITLTLQKYTLLTNIDCFILQRQASYELTLPFISVWYISTQELFRSIFFWQYLVCPLKNQNGAMTS